MVREPDINPTKKGTFGTSISFDLEEAPAPQRRSARRDSKPKEKNILNTDSSEINCPGCGHSIDEGEWLDAIVGFVSGARDFEIGNPVRARIVQTLRNEAARMKTPSAREDWELAIVKRLMSEIERIVQAEINRNNNENIGHSTVLEEQEREELIRATEAHVRQTMAYEIQEQLITELQPQIEAQLREQIEQEMWAQFEHEWKNRMNN
ncbi:MAG: hypothetical protein CMA92_01815 [Euryarchaeota archaeon]|nr:hypothetical protein [Euryarchaeota archaeon]|tara:strand:+ start:1264 stop:1887 length:624 start_codon:yes stop_codon:yes gene_type:complete